MNSLIDIQDRLANGVRTLFERLPAIIAEPRAYPREAMLLAAITALALVLLVLVIVASADVARSASRKRRLGVRSRRRWRPFVISAAVAVAILMAVAVAPGLVAVDRLCVSCHDIEAAVLAWEADPHATVSCYGCHAQGGPFGAAQASTQGLVRVLGGEPVGGVYSNRCAACHDDIKEGIVGTRVSMRHADVIDAGFACTECHTGTGHESLIQPDIVSERSMMATCLTCHDDVRASAQCDVCHEGRPSDSAGAQPVANTPTGVTCEGCHSPETSRTCVDCHGLVLPHPASFTGEHAARSWADPDLCIRCHEQAAGERGCGCHSDVNVHGTYTEWFPRHGPQASETWPGGCNCHDTVFCSFCHETSPF